MIPRGRHTLRHGQGQRTPYAEVAERVRREQSFSSAIAIGRKLAGRAIEYGGQVAGAFTQGAIEGSRGYLGGTAWLGDVK